MVHCLMDLSTFGFLQWLQDMKQAQLTEAQIDVQDLIPGTYFLRITTDDVPFNFLVIVE